MSGGFATIPLQEGTAPGKGAMDIPTAWLRFLSKIVHARLEYSFILGPKPPAFVVGKCVYTTILPVLRLSLFSYCPEGIARARIIALLSNPRLNGCRNRANSNGVMLCRISGPYNPCYAIS